MAGVQYGSLAKSTLGHSLMELVQTRVSQIKWLRLLVSTCMRAICASTARPGSA